MCLKDCRIRSLLSIRHAHGDLCKHLGIDSSTDLDDRYSNLFLNAYINRHMHTEYLKLIEVYSPLGIWHVFLYSINTNIYHLRSKVPAIRVNTTKSTYTFTSVNTCRIIPKATIVLPRYFDHVYILVFVNIEI